MDKICIVKLRKRISRPAGPADRLGPEEPPAAAIGWEAPSAQATPSPAPCSEAPDPEAGSPRRVSLTLTPEQSQVLRSDPRLVASLAEPSAGRFQTRQPRDERLIIELKFESVTPTRLLKIEEVMQMLRIGKGTIQRLIKTGKMRGYRFGRLRRVLLDDVLAYLEASREPTAPVAAAAKPADGVFGPCDLSERRRK